MRIQHSHFHYSSCHILALVLFWSFSMLVVFHVRNYNFLLGKVIFLLWLDVFIFVASLSSFPDHSTTLYPALWDFLLQDLFWLENYNLLDHHGRQSCHFIVISYFTLFIPNLFSRESNSRTPNVLSESIITSSKWF